MRNQAFHKSVNFLTAKNSRRLVIICLWMTLSILGWIFPVFPVTSTVNAGTPSPTEEIEEPVFPPVTPEPEIDSCPPLYDIPLALNSHDHFYFARPIAMDSNTNPLPDFRYGYYYPDQKTVHSGVDIPSPLHKPILAAGDGTVIFAGYGLMNGGGDTDDPYGLAVLIRHNFSFEGKTIYTVYAHMDRIDVEKGQIVKVGDQIGILGMTGNTSGPHIHFEVRIDDDEDGRIQNPELWMAPPIGSGVLAGRLKDDFGYLIQTQKIYLKSLVSEATYEILSYVQVDHIYSDGYFNENFALGDIPAGKYQISMLYRNKWYRSEITISPGTINFVYFNGKNGFTQEYPEAPDPEEFLN